MHLYAHVNVNPSTTITTGFVISWKLSHRDDPAVSILENLCFFENGTF